MARALTVGDEAPNFDLTSTEDVLLMLRDEVVRTAVVVYLFDTVEGEGVRDDLLAFARQWEALVEADVRVLGVAPAKVEPLKDLQKELHLPFPLLSDDRGFVAHYGVETGGEAPGRPRVALVDRRQIVRWIETVDSSVEALMPALMKVVEGLPSPSESLPRKVVNRLVDRWVN